MKKPKCLRPWRVGTDDSGDRGFDSCLTTHIVLPSGRYIECEEAAAVVRAHNAVLKRLGLIADR